MGEFSIYNTLFNKVDIIKNELCELADALNQCPETGFKEFKTSQLLQSKFETLNLDLVPFKDIPGFRAVLDTGRQGTSTAILCELDALYCPNHPNADPVTGAAHCCGHHVQMTAAYGAAKALVTNGLMDYLSGRIVFIAVPAEELVEVEYRDELRMKGKIRFLSGKSELIARGLFDDIDLAIAIHSLPAPYRIGICTSMNGFQVKRITMKGKAAHAAGAPYEGINALDATSLAMGAVNAWRATFREEDYIRVTPVIAKTGSSINTIPSEVIVDTLVRARTIEGISDAAAKVDRAFIGAAYAMGAEAEIKSYHGYFPFVASERMNKIAAKVAKCLGDDLVILPHVQSSTDLGDLSSLMPVIQPYVTGCSGGLHTPDFRISDDRCFLDGAKLMVGIAAELAVNHCSYAKKTVQLYKPKFSSTEEYLKFIEARYSQNKTEL